MFCSLLQDKQAHHSIFTLKRMKKNERKLYHEAPSLDQCNPKNQPCQLSQHLKESVKTIQVKLKSRQTWPIPESMFREVSLVLKNFFLLYSALLSSPHLLGKKSWFSF